jgi:hypothetical protein
MEINKIEKSINELQIVNLKKTYYLSECRYIIYGEIFLAQTGHHHSEVLIIPREVEIVNTTDQIPLSFNFTNNEELWINGSLIIFNGWPPNIRIIFEEYIIGIGYNKESYYIPSELNQLIRGGTYIDGLYKIKYIGDTRLPYYETKLLLFSIVEYKNIKIKN